MSLRGESCGTIAVSVSANMEMHQPSRIKVSNHKALGYDLKRTPNANLWSRLSSLSDVFFFAASQSNGISDLESHYNLFPIIGLQLSSGDFHVHLATTIPFTFSAIAARFLLSQRARNTLAKC